MNNRFFEALRGYFPDWYLPDVYWTDIVEIVIVAFLIYQLMVWIKNTKAWMLLKGILVLAVFILVAAILRMNTILWIARNSVSILAIAAIVVFQPELRRALEKLGEKRFLTAIVPLDKGKENERFSSRTIDSIVDACFAMGKVKTGALIVVEQAIRLTEYESTGIYLDCIVSSQVLINIFEHNTPLHDGAIIVRGNRIVSATCYLPLSDNLSISKDLGTRHRAALGISESTDSLTVVVSEETGRVSLAERGSLRRINSPEELKLAIAAKPQEETVSGPFKLLKGWHKNERKAE